MSNYASVHLVGYISEVFTQEGTKVPVKIYKTPEGKNCATTCIVVNHSNTQVDFWKAEVWSDSDSDPKIRYMLEHCQKGRQVLVQGRPVLKKDKNGTLYPTIYIDKIVGLAYPKPENPVSAEIR